MKSTKEDCNTLPWECKLDFQLDLKVAREKNSILHQYYKTDIIYKSILFQYGIRYLNKDIFLMEAQ